MVRFSRSQPADRNGWGALMGGAALAIVMAIALVVSAPHLAAQAPAAGQTPVEKFAPLFPKVPTINAVHRDFLGTWRGNNPRGNTEVGGNCGSLKDHYGNPRELCEFPVSKLEPYMNGRMRAWIEFFDEVLSPRWDCVAAGIQTGLQEGYLWEFSTTPDKLLQRWEQSNWIRDIYTDGRPHPPTTEAFYHGHSIGKVLSPTEIVVDSTNFTFDPGRLGRSFASGHLGTQAFHRALQVDRQRHDGSRVHRRGSDLPQVAVHLEAPVPEDGSAVCQHMGL